MLISKVSPNQVVSSSSKTKAKELLIQAIKHINPGNTNNQKDKEKNQASTENIRESIEEKKKQKTGGKDHNNVEKQDFKVEEEEENDDNQYIPSEHLFQYNLFQRQGQKEEQYYHFGISPGIPYIPYGEMPPSPMMGYGPNQLGYMNPQPYPIYSPFPGAPGFSPGSMPPPPPGMFPSPGPHEMMGDFHYMNMPPQFQYPPPPLMPGMFKVPLPPRKDGEAPSFVYFKQARRILIMRQKKAFKQKMGQPNKYFTRLRQKYISRQNVAKNREREGNGRFKRKDLKIKSEGKKRQRKEKVTAVTSSELNHQ